MPAVKGVAPGRASGRMGQQLEHVRGEVVEPAAAGEDDELAGRLSDGQPPSPTIEIAKGNEGIFRRFLSVPRTTRRRRLRCTRRRCRRSRVHDPILRACGDRGFARRFSAVRPSGTTSCVWMPQTWPPRRWRRAARARSRPAPECGRAESERSLTALRRRKRNARPRRRR